MTVEWPKRIRIKSRWWHIDYVPKDHGALKESDEPDDYNLGVCLTDKRHIYICTDQSPDTMRDTLVHELMHAVYSTMPKSSSEDPEEVEEAWVLGCTEAFFEIIGNSDTSWFLGEDWD